MRILLTRNLVFQVLICFALIVKMDTVEEAFYCRPYVKCNMSAVEVKFKNEFSEQIWCKVQIRNGEDLLIGVCYRTPNESISQKDNNKFLCDMIAELHGKPLLLMGDFNFPNVD